MSVHVGFTGTRDGMTVAQQLRVRTLLLELGATDLHHGVCVGSDAEAHVIAREDLGLRLHLHLPDRTTFMATCQYRAGSDTLYAPLPYLERNRAIVDATAVMIATPKEAAETTRSGTWSTIRYARKLRRPLHIVWPDGTVTTENGPQG